MALPASVDSPLCEVRQGAGGQWQGFITPPWFRYILGSTPETNGAAHQVLHGNPGGSPSWGAVDLATDTTGRLALGTSVSGQLPVANGGTSLASGTSGGILGFTGPTSIASSSLLAANSIVLGGGPGATPSAPLGLGAASQVLHGNAAGAPTWGAVNLTTDITGTLAVANGGTGTTTSTGGGSTVRSIAPTLTAPTIVGANFHEGILFTTAFASKTGHLRGSDDNQTSVTAVATTLTADKAGLFIVHDLTSGGVDVFLADATAGIVMISKNIGGIAYTRNPGVGLAAAVTVGANPRLLSVMGLEVGTA